MGPSQPNPQNHSWWSCKVIKSPNTCSIIWGRMVCLSQKKYIATVAPHGEWKSKSTNNCLEWATFVCKHYKFTRSKEECLPQLSWLFTVVKSPMCDPANVGMD